jgi:glutamyl-Q tRNA(Asp) synthetase
MITRFAPSPTGPLHLGHAFSALTVWQQAAAHDGNALLRIEDNDSTRRRPEHVAAITEDLAWLGLTWPTPVRIQSQHLPDHIASLKALDDLLYPCSCTRRQIKQAGARAGHEGLVYPGTCRHRPLTEATPTDALRLDLRRALDRAGLPSFSETGTLRPGRHACHADDMITMIGDPVLRRPGNGDIAYLLACTHDDATQKITHVVRGIDLWHQTPVQLVLQTLMNWPTPVYHHHDLIRDATGKRLAKIDKSKSLASYRAAGTTPEYIKTMVGL